MRKFKRQRYISKLLNKIHCDYSNHISDSSTQDLNFINHDQPKKALIKFSKFPLPDFSGKFEEWNLLKSKFNKLMTILTYLKMRSYLPLQSINWKIQNNRNI